MHNSKYGNGVRHERSDVYVRTILKIAVCLTLVGLVIHLLIWGLHEVLEKEAQEKDQTVVHRDIQSLKPPAPVLQISPSAGLNDLRIQEELILSNYGWVDRESKIVRIPIDRAMKLLLERTAEQKVSKPEKKP
jgi:hypothetical protein